jgi:hypothetical protein
MTKMKSLADSLEDVFRNTDDTLRAERGKRTLAEAKLVEDTTLDEAADADESAALIASVNIAAVDGKPDIDDREGSPTTMVSAVGNSTRWTLTTCAIA